MDDDEVDNVTFPNGRNLGHKVVAVAAGEAHTVALTGDGEVYSWGRGMFGRLGTGAESDETFPVRVKFEPETNLKFLGVAAGAYHSLALADDGSIWCWGYNICQLGVNGENSSVPCLLEQFIELASATSDVPLQLCSIKAGGMMSAAIDNLGTLWMWGNCPLESSSSEDGFCLVSSFTPSPVWDFHGHTVVNVACGNEHVVALVSAGEHKSDNLVCFSWGSNNHGQLGLGDKENRNRPQIVECFHEDSNFVVYEVACGAFHTALLTTKKRPSEMLESMCWTFGLGENGQLGHGTTQSALSPETVRELPQFMYLVSVDCGLFHTSVVSSAGDVWSWGMEKGLGLCPDASFTGTDTGDALSPLQIVCNGSNWSKFEAPVQVVCGAAHTLLVANDGYKLWSWGRGRSGVLGNGKIDDCLSPTIVLWPPLEEGFKQQEQNTDDNDAGVAKIEKSLPKAVEETKLLKSKLAVMEQYASILHGSIFGKPLEEQDIPASLLNSGTYDVAKEWDSMLESADRPKLLRLERFYQNMLDGVKDKLMKKRIQEIVKECLGSSTAPL